MLARKPECVPRQLENNDRRQATDVCRVTPEFRPERCSCLEVLYHSGSSVRACMRSRWRSYPCEEHSCCPCTTASPRRCSSVSIRAPRPPQPTRGRHHHPTEFHRFRARRRDLHFCTGTASLSSAGATVAGKQKPKCKSNQRTNVNPSTDQGKHIHGQLIQVPLQLFDVFGL